MKVLSFGEVLWDVYPDKKYIGGAPLNFSAHLAKHGNDVFLLSAVGKDELGEDALSQLEKWGVSTEYISLRDDKGTGSCVVTLNEKSVPSYNLLQDVAWDYIDCDEILKDFDVLYFGTLALRSDYNYKSLNSLIENKKFGEIFVDVNIRPPFYSKESVEFSLQKATILKISLEELPVVSDLLGIKNYENYKEFAYILKEKFANLKCIIITLGADGSYALECAKNEESFCETKDVKVLSTVGAGDSFSAAFLHQYMKGESVEFSLKYATKVAEYVVSEYDAVPEYDMKEFM